eukprot:scaffold73_cov337-Pavlova_lutheri.AAC.11
MALVASEELQRMADEGEPLGPDQEGDGDQEEAPRRLRKAEAVLLQRTSRVVVVLERSCDAYNHMAVLRSAEAFGVQHVWIVEPVEMRTGRGDRTQVESYIQRISRQSAEWLTVRRFDTPESCIEALRRDEREIWVTDLSLEACSMERLEKKDVPMRFAVVFGRESDGVSSQMLQAADRRVYLPMRGFAESFNLSVSSALLLQRVFLLCPEAHGDMTEEERQVLRTNWYAKLARNDKQRAAYHPYLANPPLPFRDLRRLEEHRTSWVQKKVKTRVHMREEELAGRDRC